MVSDEVINAFLSHHGIKGQKWGIRNDWRKLLGRGGSKSQLLSKYGTGSLSRTTGVRITSKEKDIAGVIGLAALGVGGAVLAKRIGVNPTVAEDFAKTVSKASKLSIKDAPTNMAHHWEKGVELSPGSVLQRVSSVKEDRINPSGFYASFEADDVTRYKSFIPQIWSNADSGYVTQLKSSKSIKAPSIKEGIEIFSKVLDKGGYLDTYADNDLVREINKASPKERQKIIKGLALKSYHNLAGQWWVPGEDGKINSLTAAYFDEVKKAGYNALIDVNNAGVANTPLRVIDSSGFNVSGNIPLSADDISKATMAVSKLPDLHHSNQGGFDMEKTVNAFLEHYGVKGMKKPVSPQRLDRVTRVAAGTAALKDRVQKARKVSIKKAADENKKREEAAKASLPDGESMAKYLLGKRGTTKLADIG